MVSSVKVGSSSTLIDTPPPTTLVLSLIVSPVNDESLPTACSETPPPYWAIIPSPTVVCVAFPVIVDPVTVSVLTAS